MVRLAVGLGHQVARGAVIGDCCGLLWAREKLPWVHHSLKAIRWVPCRPSNGDMLGSRHYTQHHVGYLTGHSSEHFKGNFAEHDRYLTDTTFGMTEIISLALPWL